MVGNKVQDFILKNIAAHPTQIAAVTSQHFNISLQAVHKHLRRLLADKKISKQGKTRGATYALVSEATKPSALPQNPLNTILKELTIPTSAIEEDEIWRKDFKNYVEGYPINIKRICEYCFTEMLNNVKDHSSAAWAMITLELKPPYLEFSIYDNGVGIFRKIRDALKIESLRESILHLSKGKLTTDKSRHSGEGIFFSSRICDRFSIVSSNLIYSRFGETDWLVGKEDKTKNGTMVNFKIHQSSSNQLARLFKNYQSPEDYSFSKTIVAVELGKEEGEEYISRSQAKRILLGLDKFKNIILDFKRVDVVGQGFVDEVFRVFKNQHPGIRIEYINANEDVEFMIKRSLS